MTGDLRVKRLCPIPEAIFAAFVDKKGSKALVEVCGDIVRFVGKDALHSAIARYHSDILTKANDESMDLSIFGMEEYTFIAHHIKSLAVPININEVRKIAEKSYVGKCFHRLDFDLNTEGDTPVFDEMMGRMSNKDAVMAWIGSHFDDGSDRAQSLVIYGSGKNGKGRLIKFFHDTYGGMAAPTNIGATKGAHWLEIFHDKRLVTIGECDNPRFITGDLMKGLTGDDAHMVNPKGLTAFIAEIKCKFLIACNTKPGAESVESHRRRIIYSEIKPITGPAISEQRYGQMLRDEGQAFLTKCWRKYQELCPDQGAIRTDAKVYDDLADDQEAEKADILHKYFVVDARLSVRRGDLQALIRKEGLFGGRSEPFLDYLSRKHGVESQQIRLWSVIGESDGVKKFEEIKPRSIVGIGLKGNFAAEVRAQVPPLLSRKPDEVFGWVKQLREWGYDQVVEKDFPHPVGIGDLKPEDSF